MEVVASLIILALLVAFGLRLFAGSLDSRRITDYITDRGGRVVSINWAPLGRGWFGEKDSRIYEVVYYDRDGNQHLATCKTRVLGGVYWTEDRIAHRKEPWEDHIRETESRGEPLIRSVETVLPGASEADDVPAELDRLRAENARLRKQLGSLEETAGAERQSEPKE